MTAKTDQRQRQWRLRGPFFSCWTLGDGFFIDRCFFSSLDSTIHPQISSPTKKENALEEAIATTLDLKCCLEAGALRDDESGERGTEESLRAKVESINRRRKKEPRGKREKK